MSLEDIRTDHITDVTDRLIKKEQPGAANHAFTAIKTFLRWCVKRRYIQHSPIEGIDLPARATSRERVLTDDELRTLWRALGKTPQPFGDILRLLVLTGQRRSEIASLKAEWCSLEALPQGGARHEDIKDCEVRAGEQSTTSDATNNRMAARSQLTTCHQISVLTQQDTIDGIDKIDERLRVQLLSGIALPNVQKQSPISGTLDTTPGTRNVLENIEVLTAYENPTKSKEIG